MRMKVIARLPALAATAPVAAIVPVELLPVAKSRVSSVDCVTTSNPPLAAAPVGDELPRPQARMSHSFPLRSIVALTVLAAVSWTAAWWGDRQRLLAERMLDARHEQAASDSRPERLARETPSAAAAQERVKP